MITWKRYYNGGAFRFPQWLSQQLWDEITASRKQTAEENAKGEWFSSDTTYGSDNIGERPTIPDWVVIRIEILATIIGFAGLIIVFAYLAYYCSH